MSWVVVVAYECDLKKIYDWFSTDLYFSIGIGKLIWLFDCFYKDVIKGC